MNDMARISEIYSGQYITAAELHGGKRRQAVIAAVEIASIGQGDNASDKVVLSLKNRAGLAWPRQLVLNKTNANLCAAAFGDETRGWPGHPLEVWAELVMFQGKLVPGIKVMPLPFQGPGSTGPASGGGGPDESDTDTSGLDADLDDEIPF
jgi:hypothetical protein